MKLTGKETERMKIENAGKKKKKGLIVGIIIGALVLIASFFPNRLKWQRSQKAA